MALTHRQLNRATLAKQLLLKRQNVSVVEAVQRVVALQAQEPASPYIALWNRIANFDAGLVDEAFASRDLVKAPLMRITLHAVHTSEYTTLHEAMLPTLRAARLNARRYRSAGLTHSDADAVVSKLVRFAATPRTRTEIEEMLSDHLGAPPHPSLWWALRTYAPLTHHPTGGPWSFGSPQQFVKAPTKPARRKTSVRHLIRRYLEGFGPASHQDIAQFAIIKQSAIRPALEAMGDTITSVDGPDGKKLFDVPDAAALPDEDAEAPPRLMAMWDSILLAYADRSRVIPEKYRKVVIRNNGDVLPTLLVDGYVAGVWRPLDGRIEATAFDKLPRDTWAGLTAEAENLAEFIGERDPATYRRYQNWWTDMPAAQRRVIA